MDNLYTVIGLMSGTSMDGIDGILMQTDGQQIIKRLAKYSYQHQDKNQNLITGYSSEYRFLLKTAEYAIRRAADMLLTEKEKTNDLIFTKESILQKARLFDFEQMLIHYASEIGIFNAAEREARFNTIATYLNNEFQIAWPPKLDNIIYLSARLHQYVVEQLLAKTNLEFKKVDLIGYHGQTVYHNPKQGVTIQLGDGKWLAEITDITVIDSFRDNDVAHGGQGAPFAPLYHQALLQNNNIAAANIVNLGGIANISIIQGYQHSDIKAGFDTGPANYLLDQFVCHMTNNQEYMDKDGAYGCAGSVIPEAMTILFEEALTDNYLKQPPPKSLDTKDIYLPEKFISLFPKTKDSKKNLLHLQNGCATLAAFTAYTLADSIQWHIGNLPNTWILSGGGAHNQAIKKYLQQRLTENHKKDFIIKSAEEAGFHTESMEAEIFAWMAVRSLEAKPLSIPQTTAVPEPLSGGRTYLSKKPTKKVKKIVEKNPAVLQGYQTEQDQSATVSNVLLF